MAVKCPNSLRSLEELLNLILIRLVQKQKPISYRILPLSTTYLPTYLLQKRSAPFRSQPDEFIRLHREALESEHVSQNLSQWIDLVFGVKQRGKAAEQANNVFYHLTYEGEIELRAALEWMRVKEC